MINLEKGQRVEVTLEKVCVGLGWEASQGAEDYDLDASAFMLGENKKLPQDEFFVFYNNLESPDHAVASSGDDLTGGGGGGEGGDDETLTVDLAKVSPKVQEILFTVTIHKAEERRQNFGQVNNAYIRIYNALTGEEFAKYELSEDFSVETAIEFGRLYRHNNGWKFQAMGVGYKGGLQFFVDKYA